MKTYEFNIVLKGIEQITDDQVDALFAAGFDDINHPSYFIPHPSSLPDRNVCPHDKPNNSFE